MGIFFISGRIFPFTNAIAGTRKPLGAAVPMKKPVPCQLLLTMVPALHSLFRFHLLRRKHRQQCPHASAQKIELILRKAQDLFHRGFLIGSVCRDGEQITICKIQ